MGRACGSCLFVGGLLRASAAPRALAVRRALLRAIDIHALNADVFNQHGVAAGRIVRMLRALRDFAGEIEFAVLTGGLISHDVRLAGFRLL